MYDVGASSAEAGGGTEAGTVTKVKINKTLVIW
jgi:hypothetical protein